MTATTLRLRAAAAPPASFTGLLLVLLILGLTGAQAASATDYTWSGLGTGGWADGNNWVGGLAPAGGAGTLTFPQLTSSACTAATPTDNCYESNYSSPTVTARRPRRSTTTSPTRSARSNLSVGAGGITATPDSADNGGLDSPYLDGVAAHGRPDVVDRWRHRRRRTRVPDDRRRKATSELTTH